MEKQNKTNRTIDDIFEMSDSRYSLVNAISRKAREIADEAESNNDVLYRKPVNMVIDRLLDGRATIEHLEEVPQENLFADEDVFAASDPAFEADETDATEAVSDAFGNPEA